MPNISTIPATTAKTFNYFQEIIEQYLDIPLAKLHFAIEFFKDDLKALAEDTRNFLLIDPNVSIEHKSESGCIGFNRYFFLKTFLIYIKIRHLL